MGDNLDVGRMNVLVSLTEMGSNNCSKQLRRRDWMLLGQYVDCVLNGVCGYDNAIVGFSVPGLLLIDSREISLIFSR